MYALGHAPRTYFDIGHYAKASTAVSELIVLAEEKGAAFWKAFGMMNEGSLLASTGKAADAIHKLTTGLAAWRSTGAGALVALYLAHASAAYAALGQFDEAWRCIAEAMAAIE